MDEKYFKALTKKCCGGGVDRISELPDEIALVILCFLSLRESAATSVLSRRWLDLWRRVPNLNLNTKLLEGVLYNMSPPLVRSKLDVESHCNKYTEMVNSVLQSPKAPPPSLRLLEISFYSINKSAQPTVAKWLEFVFSRQIEGLDLVDHTYGERDMVGLEELLRVCLPQNLIGFKSIKTLRLSLLRVKGEAIDLVLRNCPVLEKLYIHDAVLSSDVAVCGPTLALKLFDIYCCGAKYSIKVSAPNLTCLKIDSKSSKLLLENIPKLIRADYRYFCSSLQNPEDHAKQFASAVFSCISRLEILSLILHHPKAFFECDFPRIPKLKKLVVNYTGVFEHGLLPITALIWASPRLQEFELEFTKVQSDTTTWKEGITNFKRRHPHRRLKVFKFTGFLVCASDHMELLTYIIDNCVALDKIIIGSSPVFEYNLHPRAAEDRLKQLLHGKVPDYIQLHLI